MVAAEERAAATTGRLWRLLGGRLRRLQRGLWRLLGGRQWWLLGGRMQQLQRAVAAAGERTAEEAVVAA